MRECLSCKQPIPESRRKNALYCERPACRAREYRRRKREAAGTLVSVQDSAPLVQVQTDSLVITCQCGNRLLIQISHLGQAEPAQAVDPDAPTQPSERACGASVASSLNKDSEQIPSSAPNRFSGAAIGMGPGSEALAASNLGLPAQAMDGSLAAPPGTAEVVETPNRTASIESTPQPTFASAAKLMPLHDETLPRRPASDPSPGPALADARAAASTEAIGFRTYELYGVLYGRITALSEVLTRRPQSGEFELKRGAELHATTQSSRGFGLAGTPGRWRDYYPHQSPTLFGLEPDLAVLFWDPDKSWGYAMTDNVLSLLLGRRWREQLRRLRE